MRVVFSQLVSYKTKSIYLLKHPLVMCGHLCPTNNKINHKTKKYTWYFFLNAQSQSMVLNCRGLHLWRFGDNITVTLGFNIQKGTQLITVENS